MDNILTVKGDRTDICLVRCVHRFLSDSAIYGISEQDPTFDARVVRVWKDSLYRDLQRILTAADDSTIIIVDSKYDWDYRIKEVNAFVTLTKGGVKVRDDPELPISKMLSRYLDIQFTSSANGIRKALDEIGNRDAIIFIDRPPKYRKTEQEYESLEPQYA